MRIARYLSLNFPSFGFLLVPTLSTYYCTRHQSCYRLYKLLSIRFSGCILVKSNWLLLILFNDSLFLIMS